MFLPLLVFVCGMAVMIVELVAIRLFAPYAGTSIEVWTAVIGVMMAGLAGGYALGGVLGDRLKSEAFLRSVVRAAALWLLLMVLTHRSLLEWLSLTDMPGFIAVTGSMLLVAVPSVLLGMVYPYVVRLQMQRVDHAGRITGRLSALSTAGSILGTFLTGFVLVPLLPTGAILVVTAVVLVLLAGVWNGWKHLLLTCALITIGLMVWRGQAFMRSLAGERDGIIEEVETRYASIRVRRGPAVAGLERAVILEVDQGWHAAIFPEEPDTHVFPYTRFYRLLDAFRPDVGRALLLGGGGYTVARDFIRRHPRGRIDVVEIDPAVTALARKYFGLTDDPRMDITHEDARTFLNRRDDDVQSRGDRVNGTWPHAAFTGYVALRESRLQERFHVVFGDVFRSRRSIPFHMATVETARLIHEVLDDRGMYLLNIISAETGGHSSFLRAELKTLRGVFPHVALYRVPRRTDDGDSSVFRNYMIVASKVPLIPVAGLGGELADMLSTQVSLPDDPSVPVPILRDDYAPVEALLRL
ncbi:MAG: spermine synthase [Candidatus Peregrinibacteria bacterium Greene0416_19]|nr:MAG: spermine synthase [Candidatus Peregrinibacteria bacterium Greene0416_19]